MDVIVNDFSLRLLVLSFVLALLPASPFKGFAYLVETIPFLDYLNWFIPIPEMIVILESWLVIVAVYYGILYLLNYVGLVKS